jgi:benzoyl-CoA reductase/2-hydroxyglutaryl-CoA dehydratase subunit BcrC/BadD/HgdB
MSQDSVQPPKSFAATQTLKQIMADHFLELDKASRSKDQKIAWCSSVGPAELLRGMGFLVYFPENHAAMLGATRMATDLIPTANARGFSPEICSYLTSDIGSYLEGKTPLTRAYGIESLPRPDVLVFNTNQCRDVQDWFSWYAREFGVPVIGIYSHRDLGEIKDYHLQDIAQQIRDLVPDLEKVIHRPLDTSELQKAVQLSRETSTLWRSCLEMAAQIPSPWTFFDHTIHMGPAVVARGTQEAVDYYRLLLAELKSRVDEGVAAVGAEKHRLYWDGMPIWGKLRPLSELFTSLGTCIVASTYCNSWIYEQLDPDLPFESMARAYTELFIVRNEAFKEQYILDHVQRYQCDGIIFHDAKTCPSNSNTRYGLPERLRENAGIPTLSINGDLNDLRCYSEEQSKTQIEAFIEQLDE